MSILFDGTDDFLEVNSSNWRSSDNGGTISAWIKPNYSGSRIVILGSGDVGSTRYVIFNLNWVSSNMVLSFRTIEGGVSNGVYGNTSFNCAGSTWYHVAVTSNGSNWDLYVNGVAEGLSIEVGSNNGWWFNDVNYRDNLTVGCKNYGGSYGFYWGGEIDDLAYWSTPLSSAQIGLIASSKMKRLAYQIVPANLISYWMMDGGGDGTSAHGATVRDIVSGTNLTGNHGAGASGLTWKGSEYLNYP